MKGLFVVAFVIMGALPFAGCAQAEKDNAMSQEQDKVVVISTNQGDMEFKLYPDKAPKTCENFIGLAAKEYYNGLIFHRVIKGFMIQGGDPEGTGSGGESLWGVTFEDEISPDLQFSQTGILAMANRGPNTNGGQFFITLGPTPHLDDRHSVFGEVTEGMDVVRKIGKTQTGTQDRPIKPIVIQTVKIERRA